jgi:hypothetical protein
MEFFCKIIENTLWVKEAKKNDDLLKRELVLWEDGPWNLVPVFLDKVIVCFFPLQFQVVLIDFSLLGDIVIE